MKRMALSIWVFSMIFLTFFHPITAINDDLGNYLKTGEIIMHNHIVPQTNVLTYSFPAYPIINSSWLSDVILYELFNLGGFSFLLFVTSAIPALAMVLLFNLVYTKKTHWGTLSIVFLLLDGVFFDRADLRAELFSQSFTAIFLYILYKNQTKPTKLIFLLPLFELLWANLHLTFPLGLLLIGIFCIPEIIISFQSKVLTKETKKRIFILLLSIVSTIFTPAGLPGIFFLFTSWLHFSYFLEELQPIWYFHIHGVFKIGIILSEVSALILGIGLSRNKKSTLLVDWLLLCIFGLVAAVGARNLPYFRIAIFVPLFFLIDTTFTSLQTYFSHTLHSRLRIYQTLLFICIALITVWELQQATQKGLGPTVLEEQRSATNFYVQHHIQGPLFNNLEVGSYLEYRLYPQQVFTDTKFEQTPNNFYLDTYIPMQENSQIFKQQDNKYHFNSIFYKYASDKPWSFVFVHDIVNNPLWKLIYLDNQIMILVKNVAQNKLLIDTFGMTADTIHPSLESTDKTALLQIVGFFERVGWIQQERIWLEKYIQANPYDCVPLARFLQLSNTQKNLDLYQIRYQQYCQNRY